MNYANIFANMFPERNFCKVNMFPERNFQVYEMFPEREIDDQFTHHHSRYCPVYGLKRYFPAFAAELDCVASGSLYRCHATINQTTTHS